jgi:hypothetical protein
MGAQPMPVLSLTEGRAGHWAVVALMTLPKPQQTRGGAVEQRPDPLTRDG